LVCTIRLGLALVLAALLPWPAMRLLQITAGAGLIALIALTGHAGATPGTAGGIHLASDMCTCWRPAPGWAACRRSPCCWPALAAPMTRPGAA
jgi:hypothetical protein